VIRELRRRHRRTITWLAVVVPVLFLASVAGRQSHPRPAPAPPRLEPAAPRRARFTVLERPRIDGEFVAPDSAGGSPGLRLIPDDDPGIPDLLAYWAPSRGDGRTVPPNAVLLGALRGGRSRGFTLPGPGAASGGYLILLSLARAELITVVAMPS
jgi:hypothetical protein